MSAKRLTKRKLVAVRADHEDDSASLNVAQGRTLYLSKDGKRQGATPTTTCARAEGDASKAPVWRNPHPFIPTPLPPRPRPNTDQDMVTWMNSDRPQGYLEEMILLEARPFAACSSCQTGTLATVANEGIYSCEDCWGSFVDCLGCTLDAHKRNPLHNMRKWNGRFFEPTSLKELGLRVQFGHRDANYCVNPRNGHQDFTILHGNGIHKVNADFCGCSQRAPIWRQMLRTRILPSTTIKPKTGSSFSYLKQCEMVQATGKMSIYACYQALEKLTDNTRTRLAKSRYKALYRMNRQYGHLKMLKRAGRGAVPNGRLTTGLGDLALRCPACPRPGINLPSNWESFAPDEQYLFRAIVALDANFRLKNLRRPTTEDPGLQPGWAYFVEDKAYHAHIAKYPRQKDISSCSGFKTLAHAESRNADGLSSTGVGMAIDARHEFILPNGVGDLQRGERYCNMDYILLSALRFLRLRQIFLSYDIVCQWIINFRERVKAFPECLHLPDDVALACGIPKCHCKGHKIECQVEYSMNVQNGVGRTCGEGIERTWSGLNNVAAATKEMLPGGRHDALDRQMGHHNWDKLIDLARSLHRKEYYARLGMIKQVTIHEEFTSSLPEGCERSWTDRIEKWEADHSLPNPYYLAINHATEVSIRRALADEERREAARTVPLHDSSPVVCLCMGLMIEDEQREVTALLDSEESDTPAVIKLIQDKRAQLQVQFRQFRELQAVYMPGAATQLKALSGTREGDVETERILLPSSLNSGLRATGCLGDLVAKEDKLREAQCYDALETIRRLQRARINVRSFRKSHVRGQGPITKTLGIILRLEAKSDAAIVKYGVARQALLSLRGPGDWEKTLQVLGDKDIQSLNSFVFDTDEVVTKRRKTGMKENSVQFGSGRYEICWIHRIHNAYTELQNDEIQNSVRVEWLKSRARARSYTQELRLLELEKERTLLSFAVEVETWTRRATGWENNAPDLAAGIDAYCHRQADVYRRLAARCELVWASPFKPGGRRVPDRIEMARILEGDDDDESADEGNLADEEDVEGDEGEEAEAEEIAAAHALAANDDDPTLDD